MKPTNGVYHQLLRKLNNKNQNCIKTIFRINKQTISEFSER